MRFLLIFTLLLSAGCFHQAPSSANQIAANQTNSGQINSKTEYDNSRDESSAPTISPATMPDASVGKSYNVKISIANFTTPIAGVSIKDGQLPDGLTMKTKGGSGEVAEISGIPTQSGTFKFAVLVWCHGTQVSGETAYREYVMIVKAK